MLEVDIIPLQDTLVLRARGSELLILGPHVHELKSRKSPQDFSTYFMSKALINRPARKLFEAWLRKDRSLWPRIYKTIHEEMTLTPQDESSEATHGTKTERVSEAPIVAPKPKEKPAPSSTVKQAIQKPIEKPATPKQEKIAASFKEKPLPATASAKQEAKPEAPKKTIKAAPAKPVAKAPAKKTQEKEKKLDKKSMAKPSAKSTSKSKSRGRG